LNMIELLIFNIIEQLTFYMIFIDSSTNLQGTFMEAITAVH
jgi:hypothetical protein